jgi:DNA-binding NtrC family response regulator
MPCSVDPGHAPELKNPVKVLLVSPLEEDHCSLRGILSRSKWKLYSARSCREALALMREHAIPVAICERNLPDGDWKTLLDALVDLPHQPRLIVSSHHACDYLWAEVLNLGGYDVLSTPFDHAEVCRVTFLAWHSSKFARERVCLPQPAAEPCATTIAV